MFPIKINDLLSGYLEVPGAGLRRRSGGTWRGAGTANLGIVTSVHSYGRKRYSS